MRTELAIIGKVLENYNEIAQFDDDREDELDEVHQAWVKIHTSVLQSLDEDEHTDQYKNQLLHAVLNQVEQDLEDQDYEALDEMLQMLIKDKKSRDILYHYLSDEAQDDLAEFSVVERY